MSDPRLRHAAARPAAAFVAPAHAVAAVRAAAQRSTLVLAAMALAALATPIAGCAVNPVSGRREFTLVSESGEVQMGREGDRAIAGEYGLYADSALAAHVDSVGQRVARASHRPDLHWHFRVLDDPVVNAFALPGGYIYVTRGILAHLNSEAQLAGVLGHEIGHVTARHSAQRLTYQQLAGVGLGVASFFSEGFRRYSGTAETALGLLFLKYGRDDETQADGLGVEYSTKAGYEPAEIPSTYAMLKRVGARAGQRLPGFLSTHPDPGDREARTGELARAAATGRTGLLTRRGEYVARLEGLVFGADPRQGYFEGDEFYHPGLRFALGFPAGWKRENGRAAVTAVAPEQRAAMQLTLVESGGFSPSGYVDQLERSGRILAASGAPETIGGLRAWVGRLAVPEEGGAERVLAAAFIGRADDRLVQVLGRSARPGDADFTRVITSARSFRPLSDPARLDPIPERLRVTRVAEAGSFASVVGGLGPQGLDLEGTAILNNRQAEERLGPGELVKSVAPARLR